MKERIKAGRELAKKHIDKKLSRRMMIYFFMSIAILGFVAYEIIIGSIDRWIALVTIVLGVGLGLITHRMFLIYWHEDEQIVMSRIDRIGGIILVVYILFSVFRNKIVSQFFHGPTVLAVTMSLVFGLMLGRVIGMRNKIVKILKEQEILR